MKHKPQNAISWLPDDTLIEIFLCLGSSGTAKCAMVCREWNALSNDSLALWRHFTRQDFGVHLQQQQEERNEEHSNNSISNVVFEWRKIYKYISSCYVAAIRNKTIKRLPARVVFADDGLALIGYPPENAFDPEKKAWCTNIGANKNVDLIAELPTACLVTSFVAQNGRRNYTCPLYQALVFASFQEPPDLEMGKKYNDEEGSKWVEKLITLEGMDIVEEDSGKTFIHHQVKMGENSPSTDKEYQPLAAFHFPSNYDDCVDSEFKCNCASPTIARYIHFKLLNSISREREILPNIDILNLSIFGIDLPHMSEMLHSFKGKSRSDPSYERMHKLRPRGTNFVLDWEVLN